MGGYRGPNGLSEASAELKLANADMRDRLALETGMKLLQQQLKGQDDQQLLVLRLTIAAMKYDRDPRISKAARHALDEMVQSELHGAEQTADQGHPKGDHSPKGDRSSKVGHSTKTAASVSVDSPKGGRSSVRARNNGTVSVDSPKGGHSPLGARNNATSVSVDSPKADR